MSVLGRLYGRDLFDDELRAFHAAVLIDIEPVRELYNATIHRPRLVERNGIDGLVAGGRAQPQLEVFLADRALLQNVKVTAPHGLRDTPSTHVCVQQDQLWFV